MDATMSALPYAAFDPLTELALDAAKAASKVILDIYERPIKAVSKATTTKAHAISTSQFVVTLDSTWPL